MGLQLHSSTSARLSSETVRFPGRSFMPRSLQSTALREGGRPGKGSPPREGGREREGERETERERESVCVCCICVCVCVCVHV